MSTLALSTDISATLADRRLLDHPFYRRWERGEVSMAELGSYAAQYRHFERYLPQFLAQLVAALPEGPARTFVAANLADEEGDPIPHVELFERFARAVGAGAEDASPAMAQLLATYGDLLSTGSLHALAGFVAYEFQACDVAARKADGLQRYYGLDGPATSFWEHHATVDVLHREWALCALDDVTGTTAPPVVAIRKAADAWWAFLDEREGHAAAF